MAGWLGGWLGGLARVMISGLFRSLHVVLHGDGHVMLSS